MGTVNQTNLLLQAVKEPNKIAAIYRQMSAVESKDDPEKSGLK